jgi:hypothetical protein
VGFRLQLVVSSLLVGIPFTVGFRLQFVVSSLLVGIPVMVGFRLSRSLWLSRSPFHETFLSYDGILAIMEPFTNFSFSWWNFGYHRALHEFFFLTMEVITESFHGSFFQYGISAITEPFHGITLWDFGYHKAFSWNHSFTLGFRLSRSLSQTYPKLFLMVEFTWHTIWGKTVFIYITKSIYIGSALLKNLPLDLDPPLQGKEYGPPSSKLNAKK